MLEFHLNINGKSTQVKAESEYVKGMLYASVERCTVVGGSLANMVNNSYIKNFLNIELIINLSK